MAKKYIDADKLKESLKKHYTDITVPVITAEGGLESFFRRCEIKDTIKLIDSLQQEQPDNVLIPKWCLDNIENTLRIQYNINNDEKDGETCQDRNIKESLNCVRKLLNGEEITGLERLEPLMEQPEDLEKEIDNEWKKCNPTDEGMGVETANIHIEAFDIIARHFCEFGKNDMKKRMMKGSVEANVIATKRGDKYQQLLIADWNSFNDLLNGDKVRIIIVKED